jgi:peptidoglycan/LPS O-acetylase OafA/YrhL
LKESKHIPALDGLRGLAAVCVFLHHAGDMGILSCLGEFGVAVFFALSGFLMAFLYGGRSLTAGNAFSYGVSRFSRIAPLYLCVILASWLIRTHIDGHFINDINNRNLLRHLLFSGSEGVFWSIPPEVQFYGFFLFLWWAVFAARAQEYRPALIAVGITLLMLVVNFIHPLPGTSLPTKLPFFLLGAGAGLSRGWLGKRPVQEWLMSALQCVLLLAASFYALCLYGFEHDSEAIYRSALFPLLCAMMILAFSMPTRFSLDIFGNKYMRMLGAWSFAIYLLHQPCLYWAGNIQTAFHLRHGAGFVLGGIFTLTLSALSQIILERPAQHYLKAWGERASGSGSYQSDGDWELPRYRGLSAKTVSAAAAKTAARLEG